MAGKRLNQADVLEILRGGRRLAQPAFELRLLVLPPGRVPERTKMAIAVPKKLLKSAVARNRIKRLVREAFRLHPDVSSANAHILVTYKSRIDARKAVDRAGFRLQMSGLFSEATRRAKLGLPARAEGAR